MGAGVEAEEVTKEEEEDIKEVEVDMVVDREVEEVVTRVVKVVAEFREQAGVVEDIREEAGLEDRETGDKDTESEYICDEICFCNLYEKVLDLCLLFLGINFSH